jgi:Helix-turn-helix domain
MNKPKNPVDEYRFAWIEAALANRDLTHAEKVLAARLGHFANNLTLACFPGVEALAAGTGMTERTIYKLKNNLRRKNWITWGDNPGGSRRGHGISNFYELLDSHMPPGQKNPLRAAVATLSTWTGLVGEQPCPAGHSTLSREISNPAQGGEQPCPVGQPNLDNLKTNLKANLGSATAEAGSLVRALDRSALARPPKPPTHQDWWRALQKEFNLEHVQLERIAGTTVYLVARSRNEAQEIEETFGATLLERWRRVCPKVNDIRWWILNVDTGEPTPRYIAIAATIGRSGR